MTTSIAHAGEVVEIPGGAFLMGTTDPDANPHDGEGPVREVVLGPYAIAATPVTNAEFASFVAETGYVTQAQEIGWSFVFASFLPAAVRGRSPRVPAAPWWCAVTGAVWDAPEGAGSSTADRLDHPVVHVSWRDAEAYATWLGGRLPTEAEWECAARGGLVGARYPWGDELLVDGRHRCNIWQGRFPTRNTADDGYRGTCPVRAFPANGWGLYGVSGNVWDMIADRWSTDHGGAVGSDRRGAGSSAERVMRGGSYLCHDSYCNRYRVSARTHNTPDSSSGNQGFRVAFDRPGRSGSTPNAKGRRSP